MVRAGAHRQEVEYTNMDKRIKAVFDEIRRHEKIGLKYAVFDRTDDIIIDEIIMLELDKSGYKVASNAECFSVWW